MTSRRGDCVYTAYVVYMFLLSDFGALKSILTQTRIIKDRELSSFIKTTIFAIILMVSVQTK